VQRPGRPRASRKALALQYQSVERIIERLDQLKRLPHDAAAYPSGLDDVRGIVRELSRPRNGETDDGRPDRL